MEGEVSALVVFPDTNVLVQGRAMHTLPWEELGRDAIQVVICGPVIREIDRLKTRGGRAGRVARSISTLVRELMSAPDMSETLRPAGPSVFRSLLVGLDVRKAVREGLEITHDDQAIINQALALMDAGSEVMLLTDDNFAALTAKEFGLPTMLLPSHWLKEPEVDESVKEIARRDAEIIRLKSAEPSPELRFVDAAGEPVTRLEAVLKRYLPLPTAEVERMMMRIESLAPLAEIHPCTLPAKPDPDASGRGSGSFDIASIRMLVGQELPVTETDVVRYREAYAEWFADTRRRIAGLHDQLNRHREWPSATLLAVNAGGRPADDVLLEIEAAGAFDLSGARGPDKADEDAAALQLEPPPAVPVPRPYAPAPSSIFSRHHDPMHDLSRIGRLSMPPKPREDDAFYWRSGRNLPVDRMQLECRTWRHGRGDEHFRFWISAGDEAAVRGLIVAQVSASNLTIPEKARLPLRIEFEDEFPVAMAERLIDALELRLSLQ